MFKTFNVACFAAAALLCSVNSAAASQVVKAAAVTTDVAAATPVAPALPASPSALAEPAVIVTLPEPAEPSTPAVPARSRPDRADAAVPAMPAPGVAGIAGSRPPLVDLVAMHSDAAITDEQFECLASAVYFESRGEPLEGQLAVAEVILNRVRSGRFRGTICDVVKQPSQFSFVRRGVIPTAPRESAAWHRSVAIAHIALNNLADATGDDSLFFHATYVNPRWGRPRIARIGNHIFYR